MSCRALVCVILLAGPLLPHSVQAQRGRRARPSSVVVKLMTGLGGEAELDGLGPFGPDPLEFTNRVRWELENTYGLGAEFQFAGRGSFLLGAQLSLLFWNADPADDVGWDRNNLLNLSFVPKLLLPIASRRVDVYLALPIGVSRDFMDDNWEDWLQDAFGWHAGLLFGLRVGLRSGHALIAELGYRYHSVSHDRQIGPGDVDIGMGQVAFNLGFAFGM